MSESRAPSVYFPNLNGVRFFAAMAVVFCHVAQFQHFFGLPGAWSSAPVRLLGHLGVVLFFVLSGFLITYLLLTERATAGRIAIKAFYLRRVLRIWPLYYLIVLLGLVVLPRVSVLAVPELTELVGRHYALRVFLFVAFLPNVALGLTPVPFASQTWSVGVEEQFYLLWPNLMQRARRPIPMLLGVIGVYLSIRLLLECVKAWSPSVLTTAAAEIWSKSSIDCMAIGGIGACILFQSRRLLDLIFRRDVQVAVYAVTAVLIATGVDFGSLPVLRHLTYEVYAVMFAIVTLNLAANPASILSLEQGPLNYAGKISYGIYMYHSIAIVASIALLGRVGVTSTVGVHVVAIPLTLLLAALSYEFFEQPFLHLKRRFTKVVSGDEAAGRHAP